MLTALLCCLASYKGWLHITEKITCPLLRLLSQRLFLLVSSASPRPWLQTHSLHIPGLRSHSSRVTKPSDIQQWISSADLSFPIRSIDSPLGLTLSSTNFGGWLREGHLTPLCQGQTFSLPFCLLFYLYRKPSLSGPSMEVNLPETEMFPWSKENLMPAFHTWVHDFLTWYVKIVNAYGLQYQYSAYIPSSSCVFYSLVMSSANFWN